MEYDKEFENYWNRTKIDFVTGIRRRRKILNNTASFRRSP